MISSKPTVFIGQIEIAGQLLDFATGLKNNGFKTITFARSFNKFFKNSNYDYYLYKEDWNKITKIIYAIIFYPIYIIKFFIKCDIFLFQYGTTFLNGYDLPILKLFNKKIIIDARWWPAFYQATAFKGILAYMPSYNDLNRSSLKRTLNKTRMAEKYADLIIGQKNTMLWSIRPFMHFYIPIVLNKYNFHVPRNKIPKIIHAASRPLGKGTGLIESTIRKLKKDGYNFEYMTIKNMQNDELLNILSESDILIDQIFAMGPPKLALEGLASGCLVLGGKKINFEPQWENYPGIDINPSNLYDVLSKILSNPEIIYTQTNKSLEYLKEYHCPDKVMEKIISYIYEKNNEGFVEPDFFVKKFTIDDANILKIINPYTNKIKNCSWYSLTSDMNRDGLKF